MTSLTFDDTAIPSLKGKTAVITGGSSGIGLETVKILLAKEAAVHILDRNEPSDFDWKSHPDVHFHACDVTNWVEMRDTIDAIGPFHLAFANAGVAETTDFFADDMDDAGHLQRPSSTLLDVNLMGTLYLVKLAWSAMRRHKILTDGAIVLTTSTTAYAPEAALPLYSAGKLALTGLLRALRPRLIRDGITLNAVAPAGTRTPLVAPHVAPLEAVGVAFNDARPVAVALVYSATAREPRRVDTYGRDPPAALWTPGRWNGRCIFVLGDRYSELEEPTADLRAFWFGKENLELTRFQQAVMDNRKGVDEAAHGELPNGENPA